MKIIDQYHEIMTPLDSGYIYKFIELIGRTAYKSEDKITSDSAEKFIKSLIKSGHESVLEHFNITVRFVTDRGVTHELVRHRLCAFTQESTRYVNYQNKGIVFIKPVFWSDPISNSFEIWSDNMKSCECAYITLMYNSAKPQEARSVLPNSLKTEIVCTANLREWRHIFKLRTAKTAHPQMRALMIPLLSELKQKLPVFFEDIIME
jgi:thymidylate synthase (FAD)